MFSDNGWTSTLTFSPRPSAMTQNLWQATWGWGVCLVATFLVSLVTTPKPAVELEGLVKRHTPLPSMAGVPLLGRPGFWAAVALLVLIALNVYFA